MNGRTNSTSTSDVGVIDIPLDPPTSFVCEARNSKVDITWVDPKDKYATPEGEQMEDTDQLVSVWAYTKIVRKEGSQPSSPSDGITVYTSDIRNQHQSTIYEDTGVTNGVTYYYAAYAYNTDGVYSDGTFSGGITPIEWSTVLNENSWEQIDSACTQGVAQTLWEIGDEHPITISNQNLNAIIIDFNHDKLANGSGKAVITFTINKVMKYTTREDINLWTEDNFTFYEMDNDTNQLRWELARYFDDTLYNNIEEDLRCYLFKVTKKAACLFYNHGDYNIPSREDDAAVYLFPFSVRETYGDYTSQTYIRDAFAKEGTEYPYFATVSNLALSQSYILRSFYHSSYSSQFGTTYERKMYTINTNGTHSNSTEFTDLLEVGASCYIRFGFCVGKSSV